MKIAHKLYSIERLNEFITNFLDVNITTSNWDNAEDENGKLRNIFRKNNINDFKLFLNDNKTKDIANNIIINVLFSRYTKNENDLGIDSNIIFFEYLITNTNSNKCDFRSLLWVLQSIFTTIDPNGTKYGSKRIFIFTMNDNPKSDDLNSTYQKSKDMLDTGIDINIFPLNKNFNMSKFYKNIIIFKEDEFIFSLNSMTNDSNNNNNNNNELSNYCLKLSD